jgi:hypothetical protein
MSIKINFNSINFSNLGNLILGVSGAASVFTLTLPIPLATKVSIAGIIASIGVMSKAICSAISEYQYPAAGTPVVASTPVVAVPVAVPVVEKAVVG